MAFVLSIEVRSSVLLIGFLQNLACSSVLTAYCSGNYY